MPRLEARVNVIHNAILEAPYVTLDQDLLEKAKFFCLSQQTLRLDNVIGVLDTYANTKDGCIWDSVPREDFHDIIDISESMVVLSVDKDVVTGRRKPWAQSIECGVKTAFDIKLHRGNGIAIAPVSFVDVLDELREIHCGVREYGR